MRLVAVGVGLSLRVFPFMGRAMRTLQAKPVESVSVPHQRAERRSAARESVPGLLRRPDLVAAAVQFIYEEMDLATLAQAITTLERDK